MSTQDVSAGQGSEATAAEPPSFDITRAHPARVYDYWLGGKDNYEADREAAEQFIEVMPSILGGVRANRAFLRRAVQYLAGEAGIRQFLDIGTGLPTAENTHEVAQAIAPESRIVYVDNDPIVLAHATGAADQHPGGRHRLRRRRRAGHWQDPGGRGRDPRLHPAHRRHVPAGPAVRPGRGPAG